MHSSVGTGSLAYVVGSKVMDMRTSSKLEREMKGKTSTSNDNNIEVGKYNERSIICTEAAKEGHHESSNGSVDLASLRASTDGATYDSYGQQNCSSPNLGRETDGSHCVIDSPFDFPALPVTNLFEKSGKDNNSSTEHGSKLSARHRLRFDDEMHTFQINDNVDLIGESNGQQPRGILHSTNSEIEIASPDEDEPEFPSDNAVYEAQMVNQLKISDVPQPARISAAMSQEWPVGEDRVSEWLWTLHRIGI